MAAPAAKACENDIWKGYDLQDVTARKCELRTDDANNIDCVQENADEHDNNVSCTIDNYARAANILVSFAAAGWLQMYHFGVGRALQDCRVGLFTDIIPHASRPNVANNVAPQDTHISLETATDIGDLHLLPPRTVRASGTSAGSLAAVALIMGISFDRMAQHALDSAAHCRHRPIPRFFLVQRYLLAGAELFKEFFVNPRGASRTRRRLEGRKEGPTVPSIFGSTPLDPEAKDIMRDRIEIYCSVLHSSGGDNSHTTTSAMSKYRTASRQHLSTHIFRHKVFRNIETIEQLKEALCASCCVFPICGVPFRLKYNVDAPRSNEEDSSRSCIGNEWVLDGGLAAFQPRKHERWELLYGHDTRGHNYEQGTANNHVPPQQYQHKPTHLITVSALYYDSADIRPSTYVPVYWALYPPSLAEYYALFELGYKDCIHYLVTHEPPHDVNIYSHGSLRTNRCCGQPDEESKQTKQAMHKRSHSEQNYQDRNSTASTFITMREAEYLLSKFLVESSNGTYRRYIQKLHQQYSIEMPVSFNNSLNDKASSSSRSASLSTSFSDVSSVVCEDESFSFEDETNHSSRNRSNCSQPSHSRQIRHTSGSSVGATLTLNDSNLDDFLCDYNRSSLSQRNSVDVSLSCAATVDSTVNISKNSDLLLQSPSSSVFREDADNHLEHSPPIGAPDDQHLDENQTSESPEKIDDSGPTLSVPPIHYLSGQKYRASQTSLGGSSSRFPKHSSGSGLYERVTSRLAQELPIPSTSGLGDQHPSSLSLFQQHTSRVVLHDSAFEEANYEGFEEGPSADEARGNVHQLVQVTEERKEISMAIKKKKSRRYRIDCASNSDNAVSKHKRGMFYRVRRLVHHLHSIFSWWFYLCCWYPTFLFCDFVFIFAFFLLLRPLTIALVNLEMIVVLLSTTIIAVCHAVAELWRQYLCPRILASFFWRKQNIPAHAGAKCPTGTLQDSSANELFHSHLKQHHAAAPLISIAMIFLRFPLAVLSLYFNVILYLLHFFSGGVRARRLRPRPLRSFSSSGSPSASSSASSPSTTPVTEHIPQHSHSASAGSTSLYEDISDPNNKKALPQKQLHNTTDSHARLAPSGWWGDVYDSLRNIVSFRVHCHLLLSSIHPRLSVPVNHERLERYSRLYRIFYRWSNDRYPILNFMPLTVLTKLLAKIKKNFVWLWRGGAPTDKEEIQQKKKRQ